MPTVNNAPLNSTKPSTTSNQHVNRQKPNAQKPLPNCNSNVHKVVSTPATSSNPATMTSKNRTENASDKLSNSVAKVVAKMTGVTITPLATLSKKIEPDTVIVPVPSQKICGPKGSGNLNKNFKPTLTSTPKLINSLKAVNINNVRTLPERKKHINPEMSIAAPKAAAESKISHNLKSLNANCIKTVSQSNKYTSSKTPIAISKATTEVQPSLSISKLAKTLPGISISPLGGSPKLSESEIPTSLLASLGKTGITITKNAVKANIHESQTTSTCKQSANANLNNASMAKRKSSNCSPVVQNGAITKTIRVTDKQEVSMENAGISKNKNLAMVKPGVTITKTAGTVSITPTEKHKLKTSNLSATSEENFLKNIEPVSRLVEGAKTGTKSNIDKNSLTNHIKEFSGINGIAVKSGTSIPPVAQVSKQSIPKKNTKVIHTNVLPTNTMAKADISTNCKLSSMNNGKQEGIAGSLSTSTQIKGNHYKLQNNGTPKHNVPILPKPLPTQNIPKSVSNSLTSLKSNKSTKVQPVSVSTKSKKSLPQKVNSQNIRGVSKKRTLLESDSQSGGTNKKAKFDPKPLLNATHTNIATFEENMKRISALKESLEKMAESFTENSNTKQHSKEYSNSRINGLVKNNKTGQLSKDLEIKKNVFPKENLPTENMHSKESKLTPNKKSTMKKDQNEKPLKQV